MFTFDVQRPRRRPSLTPMIDVVFLLLVFFMLAARFGQDFAVPLTTLTSGAEYSGPPRVITLSEDETSLNGVPLPLDAIVARMPSLMADQSDLIFVQPTQGASLQHLIDVMEALRGGGLGSISVVGAP